MDAAEKLLAIEALTAAYLLGGAEARAVRPLGKGTGAVVERLSGLLARHLPAAALVEEARIELNGAVGSVLGRARHDGDHNGGAER